MRRKRSPYRRLLTAALAASVLYVPGVPAAVAVPDTAQRSTIPATVPESAVGAATDGQDRAKTSPERSQPAAGRGGEQSRTREAGKAAKPSVRALAPASNEWPSSWTVTGKTATGTTPSGVTVTATLTGPVSFYSAAPTGSLVFSGPVPSYLPTTTSALRLTLGNCTTAGDSGCGTITYSFSRPVTTPVLYTGDVGASQYSQTTSVVTTFHQSPVTLLDEGTKFSLDAAGSQSSRMRLANGDTTYRLVNNTSPVGQRHDSNSCGTQLGCGAYAIDTATPYVTRVSMGVGYEGTGTNLDGFTQLLSATPVETDLAVTKTGPASVTAGGDVSYGLKVTNNGPNDSTGWTLNDPVPAGLENAATTTEGCSITGGELTCTGGELASGDSRDITLTGTAGVNADEIVNTATVTGKEHDPDPDNNEDTTTTTVNRSVDLALTKTGPATATAGDGVSYTVKVTNNGPSDSTGWTVSDPIPAGLENAASTTAGCTVSGGDLTCTGGALAVGDSRDITLTGTAAVDADEIVNTATVTGDDPDPDPGNNEDTTTTTIEPSVDLAVTKTGPASVSAGGDIAYTITIMNDGPSRSSGWTLRDPIPAGLTDAATTTEECSIAAGVLTCRGGALDVGSSVEIELTGQASPEVSEVVNTARVTGDDPDPNPDNNEDKTTTDVEKSADLAVVKSGPATVAPGGKIDYTVTVTNNGPSASSGWTLTDTIPARIQDASTSTDGCAIDAGELNCTGGALAVGDSRTLKVSGTVDADERDTITNTAEVTGKDPDPDPGNNKDNTTTEVKSEPGLEIVKKQEGPKTVKAGAKVRYTTTVTNTGTSTYTDANPAEFTDNLSNLLDDARYNQDASATRGTVGYKKPTLSWSGALAPGESARITFSITTDARPFGDTKLRNTVVSDTPGNNCPSDSRDPRCTTLGKVDARDKDKK